MGFTRAGLAIGKDGSIVALNDLVDEIGPNGFVDFLLFGIGREDVIEAEDFIFSGVTVDILNQKLLLFDIKIQVLGQIYRYKGGYFWRPLSSWRVLLLR